MNLDHHNRRMLRLLCKLERKVMSLTPGSSVILSHSGPSGIVVRAELPANGEPLRYIWEHPDGTLDIRDHLFPKAP